MKKILIIAIISFAACTKERLQPTEKSVTWLLHYNRPDGSLIKTDTSVHWCRVDGEDLKRFEQAKRVEFICNTYNTLELIIGKPCRPILNF